MTSLLESTTSKKPHSSQPSAQYGDKKNQAHIMVISTTRLFVQSDRDCRQFCEDTADCRFYYWSPFSFNPLSIFFAKNFCRKSAKEINYFALNWGFCRYPIIIIIFFRYPIDYSPSPLYCYLFRRCPTAPSLLITKFLSSQLNLMF